MNNRAIRLKKNTISSVILQLTAVICGFVLPRMILGSYGSEVNGLVSSISQFLSFISLMEMGMGAVVQSNLYKPIAENNRKKINEIISSANKFFKLIGKVLLIYVFILMILYPYLVKKSFPHMYTALLILAISISFFAQYYIGVVDRIFLSAAQMGYVQYNAQTISLIANTVFCCIFIKMGASIHIVKLTTSLIYLLRPVAIRMYINKHYQIKRNVDYEGEPIRQKWNGIAQHVAAVVLGQTDVTVLTIFATLDAVSVYTIYFLVVSGVKQFFTSFIGGFESLIGEMWAKKETEKLKRFFAFLEWLLHTGTVLFFGCTMILIVPFVQVYTNGVQDANYIQPLFGALLTWAYAGPCFRLPYNIMILAAGRYKETQANYIIAAVMNIIVSIAMVKKFGLIGVTIGTFVALFYQTVWMANYNAKKLLDISRRKFAKQIAVDVITILIAGGITYRIPLRKITYMSWLVMAISVFLIWLVIIIVVNKIFYKDHLVKISCKLKEKFKGR